MFSMNEKEDYKQEILTLILFLIWNAYFEISIFFWKHQGKTRKMKKKKKNL